MSKQEKSGTSGGRRMGVAVEDGRRKMLACGSPPSPTPTGRACRRSRLRRVPSQSLAALVLALETLWHARPVGVGEGDFSHRPTRLSLWEKSPSPTPTGRACQSVSRARTSAARDWDGTRLKRERRHARPVGVGEGGEPQASISVAHPRRLHPSACHHSFPIFPACSCSHIRNLCFHTSNHMRAATHAS